MNQSINTNINKMLSEIFENSGKTEVRTYNILFIIRGYIVSKYKKNSLIFVAAIFS